MALTWLKKFGWYKQKKFEVIPSKELCQNLKALG